MTAKDYLCPKKKDEFPDMSKMFTRTHFNLIKDSISENAIVALIDINKMMVINDSYGHKIGDKVILAVYDSLVMEFGATNVFRYGGDEFLIIEYDNRDFDGIRSYILMRELDVEFHGMKIEWSMQMCLFREIDKLLHI